MTTNSIGRLQKWTGYFIFFLIITSCKSTKVIGDGTIDKNLSAKAIIRNHYNSQINFKTLSGKAKIDYSDGEATKSFTVSLRMEKDKAIWISAPMGVLKALITPDRVTFYNKLDNEYFDGDFTYFSEFLGTELNFVQIQNVLLGQALFNLKDEKYRASIEGGNYVLKPAEPMELFKTLFEIDPKTFKIAVQQLSQPEKKRLLNIRYKDYYHVSSWILPGEILVTAIDKDSKSTIKVEYKNITFNMPLSFPYSIPKGFKEIVLK